MAYTFIYIHDLCVIIADIVTRNFFLAADLLIKFLDFIKSFILSLDINI
jgi:hypothetical protein